MDTYILLIMLTWAYWPWQTESQSKKYVDAIMNKSSSGDEMPERDNDVSSYMTTYLSLNYDTPVLPEYVRSNAYLLHI